MKKLIFALLFLTLCSLVNNIQAMSCACCKNDPIELVVKALSHGEFSDAQRIINDIETIEDLASFLRNQRIKGGILVYAICAVKTADEKALNYFIDFLLTKCPQGVCNDMLHATDAKGQTALMHALSSNKKKIVATILQHVQRNKCLFSILAARCSEQIPNTTLDYAMTSGDPETVALILGACLQTTAEDTKNGVVLIPMVLKCIQDYTKIRPWRFLGNTVPQDKYQEITIMVAQTMVVYTLLMNLDKPERVLTNFKDLFSNLIKKIIESEGLRGLPQVVTYFQDLSKCSNAQELIAFVGLSENEDRKITPSTNPLAPPSHHDKSTKLLITKSFLDVVQKHSKQQSFRNVGIKDSKKNLRLQSFSTIPVVEET